MGEKFRESTPARFMWSSTNPRVAIHTCFTTYFLKLWIEAPFPPVIPVPLYVGVRGATNMQEMKASKYPTVTSTQNITQSSSEKIMLLAQKAKQPATKLQYIEKETYLNIDLTVCLFLTASVRLHDAVIHTQEANLHALLRFSVSGLRQRKTRRL